MIIPYHEGVDPGARRVETATRLRGKGGVVFQGTQQRFGVRVVIAHPRPTEGRHAPEALHGGEHGGAFHRAAVVRVQHEAGRRDGLLVTHPREQRHCVRVTLRWIHRPADDAATPNIHDQVEIPEHAPQRTIEVRDVPAPHLLLSGRLLRGHLAALGRLRAATMSELTRLAQQAIHRRFGRDIHDRIGVEEHPNSRRDEQANSRSSH